MPSRNHLMADGYHSAQAQITCHGNLVQLAVKSCGERYANRPRKEVSSNVGESCHRGEAERSIEYSFIFRRRRLADAASSHRGRYRTSSAHLTDAISLHASVIVGRRRCAA